MIQKKHFKDKKELAKYINNHIYGILKPYGYKKNGNDFYIEKEKISCLINLSKARYVDPDEERFTITWCLSFPMSQYFYNQKASIKPSSNTSTIGGDITKFQGSGNHWWTLRTSSSEKEINEVLKEVEWYVTEYAVPFLAKLNILEDVIEMLEATKTKSRFCGFYPSHINPEPFQAILYLYINQKEKSIAIMDEIIATTKVPSVREGSEHLKQKIQNFDPTKY
jgi:hypothetical protein